jgi:8-oxo-dGTP pyrophosphatase MutT (NUDIX family)
MSSGTRAAAAALLLGDPNRLLVVNPTYKPGWGLPGGVIESNESPLAACVRELEEELGIAPEVECLVGVDWIPARLGRDPANVFVFVGHVTPVMAVNIELPPDELSEYRFQRVDRLDGLLPDHVVRRVRNCLAAYRAGRMVYLEFGQQI